MPTIASHGSDDEYDDFVQKSDDEYDDFVEKAQDEQVTEIQKEITEKPKIEKTREIQTETAKPPLDEKSVSRIAEIRQFLVLEEEFFEMFQFQSQIGSVAAARTTSEVHIQFPEKDMKATQTAVSFILN